MAKLFGISGKATGKKGDTVFAVRNGEQLIRQYNPIVSNPNTADQIDARAKLKLGSQMSAILGEVIAMPREGTKSPRNIWLKENYNLISAQDGVASMDMEKIKLTKSVVACADLNVNRNGSTDITVRCTESMLGQVDKMVYVGVQVGTDQKIRVYDTAVVDVDSNNINGSTTLSYTGSAVVVLGYGISMKSGKARAAFNDIEGDEATHIASLIATRTLGVADLGYTETKGMYLSAL